MATQEQKEALVALYAGYFNRAPDPAGLQFWIDQIDNGREFNTIAADFAASAEATALYPYLTQPDVASPTTFITSVYQNLFNRVPDPEGLEFWKGVLESGAVSVADMIEAIINGARDTDTTKDKSTLDNKVEVGLDWTMSVGDAGIEWDAAAKAAAVAAIAGVTSDPATVATAKEATDDFVAGATNAGETFVLTTGQDNVTGTEGNDEIFGLFEDSAAKTLTLGDIIDGGAGDDTLTVTNDSDSNLSFAGRTITSVENLVVENAATGLDTINVAGKEFDNITLDVGTNDVDMNIDVDNVAAASAVTVQNIGGDANHNLDIDFNASTAASGSTTVTLQDLDVNEMYTTIDADFSAATAYEFNLNVSDVDSNDNFNVNANVDLDAADVALAINVDVHNVTGEDVNMYLDFNTNGVASTDAVVNITDSNMNQLDIDIDNNSNGTGDQDVLTLNVDGLNADGNQDLDVDADDFETVNINVGAGGALFDDLDFSDNAGNDFALNIVADGDMSVDSDINMNSNVGSSTITVSGAGNVDLGEVDFYVDGDDQTVMTIDASALTGDLTVEDGNGNGNIASIDMLTSGSGNDDITLDGYTTAVVTGAGDDRVDTNGADYGDADAKTIDGGDGVDTIAITDGALLDADFAANISNFETLDFSDGNGTYDMSAEASLANLSARGSIAGPVSITNFKSSNNLTLAAFVDVDAITVSLATDGAADATTVNLIAEDTTENNTADGGSDAVLVAEEFETITINSTGVNAAGDVDGNDVAFVGGDYMNTVDLNASDMTKLVVTGDAMTEVVFTGAEALAQIDATANTGGVTIDASAGAVVAGISFAGTDAADVFTATANGDVVQGNGGADNITLGAGEDVVRYVSQSDSVLTLTDTSDPADGVADTAEGWDVVNGFTAGDDIIELSSLLGLATGDARSAVLQKGGFASTAAADLQTYIGNGTDFFSNGLVDRAVAFSTDGVDGLVFVDVNGDGDFSEDDDMMIELAGVTTFTVSDVQFG